ncbi:MAG: hypothetical protein AAF557_01015 [Pseudomonadota bacterium]
MARRKIGRLTIGDFGISQLEDAVKAGFEARRGPLFNALRALNAFTIFELGRCSVADDYSDRDVKELVHYALENQMEKELSNKFRFLYCHGMGRRKFGDPPGLVTRLEVLIPEFVEGYQQRKADGMMAPKGGLLRWCLGIQEVGKIGGLLRFARRTLQFASFNFDTDTRYPELEERLNFLIDLLPEWHLTGTNHEWAKARRKAYRKGRP